MAIPTKERSFHKVSIMVYPRKLPAGKPSAHGGHPYRTPYLSQGIPSNGYTVNPDDWDGYNADREHLVDYLRANPVSDVVFITGDIHCSWANELTTRSTVLSPTAVEFVVSSVTSDNFDDFTHVPPDTLSLVAAGLLRAANPHVRWTELDQHGYGVLSVTPERCRMDYYFVTDRTRPDAGRTWRSPSRSVVAWHGCARSRPSPRGHPRRSDRRRSAAIYRRPPRSRGNGAANPA
jgi:phosphodiesterase/alkaline phosphatase D-like protein